ncbi:MAG: hypothetical protein AB1589_23020 [Cyanobacteriota bacterium]
MNGQRLALNNYPSAISLGLVVPFSVTSNLRRLTTASRSPKKHYWLEGQLLHPQWM